MSATAQKPRVGKRSRLEIVEAALAKDEQALEEARARFVELAAAEDDAVRESKRANPEASPYALRSPAQQIRAEREQLDKTISGLERGIVALKAECVAASAEHAARELGERTKQARRLAERERELRREAAAAFAELVTNWNALADLLSERSSLAAQVAGEQLVERVGIFDRDAIASWEAVAGYIVVPVPVELSSFLDELLEASTGERTDIEAEHRAVDEINARRREIAKRDPGGVDDLPMVPKPAIRENPLHELVPDLRGSIASATVSGVEIRRSVPTEEAPWPERAA
jgi:hypothetical protein